MPWCRMWKNHREFRLKSRMKFKLTIASRKSATMKAVQLNLVQLTAGPNLQYDWIRTDWDVQLIGTTAVQLAFSFLLWDLLLLRGNSSFFEIHKFLAHFFTGIVLSVMCSSLMMAERFFSRWWDWCCSSNFLMEFIMGGYEIYPVWEGGWGSPCLLVAGPTCPCIKARDRSWHRQAGVRSAPHLLFPGGCLVRWALPSGSTSGYFLHLILSGRGAPFRLRSPLRWYTTVLFGRVGVILSLNYCMASSI